MPGRTGQATATRVHQHGYTKLLMCATGSITFLVGTDASPVELAPGDGFVLPAGTPHAAVVGPGRLHLPGGPPDPGVTSGQDPWPLAACSGTAYAGNSRALPLRPRGGNGGMHDH